MARPLLSNLTFLLSYTLLISTLLLTAQVSAARRKIPPDSQRGPRGSTYVAIRVEDDYFATVSKVRQTQHFGSEFTRITADPFPMGAPVEDVVPFDPLDFGLRGLNKTLNKMTWMITYEDENGTRYGKTFIDPRIRVGETRFGPDPTGPIDDVNLYHKPVRPDGSRPPGFVIARFPDIYPVWVPPYVRFVTLYCRNTSMATTFSLDLVALQSQHRAFEAQTGSSSGASGPAQFWIVQKAGPVSTQQNIVILAAGFTGSTEDQLAFNVTLARLIAGMTGVCTLPPLAAPGTTCQVAETTPELASMKETVPFERYWSFYNVFAVFQPSTEAGASQPAIGLEINSNLQCYHPATLQRAIVCNIELAEALAAVSPAPVYDSPDRTIIQVIVNTNLYGGAAIFQAGAYHLAQFYRGWANQITTTNYNDPTFSGLILNSLIKHETGHAYGYLFDEYNYGITEPQTIPLENCMAPGVSPVPWQGLIDVYNNGSWSEYAIKSDVDFAVASSPLLVCGYSNYYKGNYQCMMDAVNNYFMCPVCREQVTMTIWSDPLLNITWPRYPQMDAHLILPITAPTNPSPVFSVTNGALLFLPSAVNSGNYFDVHWVDYNGNSMDSSILSGTGSLELSISYLSGLSSGNCYNYTAYVTDVTNYMTEARRGQYLDKMSQSAIFTVCIVDSIDGIENVTYTEPLASAGGSVNVGGGDSSMYGNMGFYTVCYSHFCRENFTASPYQQPPGLSAIVGSFDSWAMYMLGGIGVVFILLWMWGYSYYMSNSSKVVRPIFRTKFSGLVGLVRRIMMFSAIIFMLSSLAALGVSAYFYSKTTSLGKIIIILGAVLAFVLYVMAFIGYWAVSYRSKRLVIVNGAVLYVGLTVLVAITAVTISVGQNVSSPSSYWNNLLRTFWVNLVASDSARACAIEGMLQCSGFYYACNSVIQSPTECPANCQVNNRNFGTACQLLMANYITQNYHVIIEIIGTCLGLMFFALIFDFIYFLGLARMKYLIRQRNNKRLHRVATESNISLRQAQKYKAIYLLKSMDDGDMKHLMREFERIDTNGNGQLDRRELAIFFKRALCYAPTSEEIDEIFRVADLNGDGTISFDEFMCLFNKQAASHVNSSEGSKRSPLRRSVDPTRHEELKRRASKVFGDDMVCPQATAVEMNSNSKPVTSTQSQRAVLNQSPRPASNQRNAQERGDYL